MCPNGATSITAMTNPYLCGRWGLFRDRCGKGRCAVNDAEMVNTCFKFILLYVAVGKNICILGLDISVGKQRVLQRQTLSPGAHKELIVRFVQ